MSISDRFLPEDCDTPRLEAWRCRMRHQFGRRVVIVFTNNRRSMVSLQRNPDRTVTLRMQKGFEHAPDTILNDLELLLSLHRTAAWERVCAFAKTIPVSGPPLRLDAPESRRTQGRVHNLQEILEEVNREFFESRLATGITWGRRNPSRRGRRRSRSLQFGAWDESLDLVRIHPALDDGRVPRDFLRYLVYHELCHAARPPVRGPAGSRRIHHPEFKELEKRYPNLARMEAMGKRLFDRIIRER